MSKPKPLGKCDNPRLGKYLHPQSDVCVNWRESPQAEPTNRALDVGLVRGVSSPPLAGEKPMKLDWTLYESPTPLAGESRVLKVKVKPDGSEYFDVLDPPAPDDHCTAWEAWQAAVREAVSECAICQHEWNRHDPEDGRCDAGPPCKCGRDLDWMQSRIAELSQS